MIHAHDIAAPLLLVDGRRTPAADGATYPVLDPASGRTIAQAPAAGPADLDAAIDAARRAFDETSWATDPDLRVRCVRQLHEALVDRAPAMRALLTAEAGVPVALTAGPQYDGPVDALRRIAGRFEAHPDRLIPGRAAAGVVAAITPYSSPVGSVLAKLGPALLAGGTVVLKPAADTPWVACELARLAVEHTDLPPGVLNVVTTRDVDVAIALTTDARVDLVSFTGSAVTGARVREAAGSAGKQVIVSVGEAPVTTVADDADLPDAVRRATHAVAAHAGQDCKVAARLVVPAGRYDEAVGIAAETMTFLAPGDPTDPATVCGPVISAVHRDRVRRYLALALAEGGSFVCGGGVPERDGGFWVEPTVVAGLDRSARSAREEIFGPVLVVLADDEG